VLLRLLSIYKYGAKYGATRASGQASTKHDSMHDPSSIIYPANCFGLREGGQLLYRGLTPDPAGEYSADCSSIQKLT